MNDTLGPEAGDDLLRAVADPLIRVFSPEAVVGRLGGDKFVVVCSEPLVNLSEVSGLIDSVPGSLVESAGPGLDITSGVRLVRSSGGESVETCSAMPTSRSTRRSGGVADGRGRRRVRIQDELGSDLHPRGDDHGQNPVAVGD